jgi:aminoacyl-tRNA hydrolase
MKLLFAQGNPGSEYARTRHNIGWQCLDALAHAYGAQFSPKPKLHAATASATIAGQPVLLAKPTTFYNDTGRAAQAILRFYKLPPQALLVLHDELALEFGIIRVRHSGSDAGNNGIKSLNAHLGQGYARLRIGIHNQLRRRMGDATFVLKPFSQAEQEALNTAIIPATTALVEQFAAGTLADTSQRVYTTPV